jgi:copper(I)-binding protein
MSKTLALFAIVLFVGRIAAAQTGSVEIKNAWARATPGKADVGAAYMTLESSSDDRLTGLSTPIASDAHVHTMVMERGVMKMNPVPALDLPAGKPVKLEPGGLHVMLLGLKDKLEPGQSFPMTLTFEKAGKREVMVSVEKAGAMGPAKAHEGAMPMGQMPMPAGR